jgi:hypothetical protein
MAATSCTVSCHVQILPSAGKICILSIVFTAAMHAKAKICFQMTAFLSTMHKAMTGML